MAKEEERTNCVEDDIKRRKRKEQRLEESQSREDQGKRQPATKT